ncbi:MAG: carboxylesterase family protein [Bacteroidetes bacterium]|nr:carboxylesterase family protein [Bacteroidota bacterium]
MKKLLLLFPLSYFLTFSLSHAQTYCGTPRYDTVVFSSTTVTSNVVFGSNVDLNGNTVTLKMDIYEPAGDTASMRPVIVFAHGGSFVGGDKADSYCVDFCQRFAKRGYVTCSINYRLGMGFPINQDNGQKAVWRAVQDMKAAVRFFRKDANTTNTYKIDPNYVFIAGMSAGGFMTVHYAYLDQPSEIPSGIDTTKLGNLEGSSGNPYYCSRVNAIINYAGAIADTNWMHTGDEPMITCQGNNDNTVPYCTAMIYVGGFPIMVVSGGGTMTSRCKNIGLENPMHTYYTQGHSSPMDTVHVNGYCNMDTTAVLTSNFLYHQLGCAAASAMFVNQQTCNPTDGIDTVTSFYTSDPCPLDAGINEMLLNEEKISIVPNPAVEAAMLMLKDVKGKKFSAEIHDVTGRKVRQFEFSGKNYLLERNKIPPGIYFIRLKSDAGELLTAKLIFE